MLCLGIGIVHNLCPILMSWFYIADGGADDDFRADIGTVVSADVIAALDAADGASC